MKRATIAELEEIFELVKLFYNEESYHFNDLEIKANLKILLENPYLGTIFLITSQEITAGYCMIINSFCLELGGKIGYLDELFIKSDFRNKGLSTKYLKLIIDSYKLSEYATLRLEVEMANLKAQELYKRIGFQPHARLLMSYQL